MFSIQIDTTQDILSQELRSVIVRYVLGNEILERLLAVIKRGNSSGNAFKSLVVKILTINKIDTRKCIDSFTHAMGQRLCQERIMVLVGGLQQKHQR